MILSEEEKNRIFVQKDSMDYLVIGTGHTLLERVQCKERWKPSNYNT